MIYKFHKYYFPLIKLSSSLLYQLWFCILIHDNSHTHLQNKSSTLLASICLFLQRQIPRGSGGNPPAVQEISGSGRSPRKGNGYPLQYSYLANSMDRGAWKATVLGSQSDMTELLNTYRFFSIHLLLVNLIFPLTYINNRGLLD